MNIIDDKTFGRLEFDYGWRKNDIKEFWGKERKFEVVIDAYTKEDEITKLQKETFVSFYDNFQSLMDQALKGIFNYYEQNYKEIASQCNSNEREKAPIIKSENEMVSIIQPLQLIICNTVDKKRVVGLTSNCTWDPEHGIGVKFVNEKIIEIGTQDIVL